MIQHHLKIVNTNDLSHDVLESISQIYINSYSNHNDLSETMEHIINSNNEYALLFCGDIIIGVTAITSDGKYNSFNNITISPTYRGNSGDIFITKLKEIKDHFRITVYSDCEFNGDMNKYHECRLRCNKCYALPYFYLKHNFIIVNQMSLKDRRVREMHALTGVEMLWREEFDSSVFLKIPYQDILKYLKRGNIKIIAQGLSGKFPCLSYKVIFFQSFIDIPSLGVRKDITYKINSLNSRF